MKMIIRYASSLTKTSQKPVDDYTYCINSVRKVDYENFLCTGLLRPALLQRPVMALRALNVELASIRDQVSNTQIGQMRLQFWRETIDSIYSSINMNINRKINHPVAREIDLVVRYNQLSKLWFHRLIKSREITLNDMPFTDIEQLENYLEQSITPTYYLLLELAKQRSLNADHIASHLGIKYFFIIEQNKEHRDYSIQLSNRICLDFRLTSCTNNK
jgi:NADH dehydrogenase [ubiquinone] 1 alpha subcomplex assembly factor 6